MNMLANSLHAGRKTISRTFFLCSYSFHSAMKRQMKADKKAKEKEARMVSDTADKVGFYLN